MTVFAILLFSAFVATRFLICRLFVILRKYFVDLPCERSSHVKPTPRGGGVVVAFMIFASVCLFNSLSFQPPSSSHLLLLLMACSMPISLVGLIDDRVSLSPLLRLVLHLGFATLCVLALAGASAGAADWLQAYFTLSPVLFLPIAVVVVVALVNLTNFMDGLDGLVASSFLLISVAAALFSGEVYWLLFSAPTAAFLTWNWAPARLFLGDSGSTWMGMWIGLMFLMMPSAIASFHLIAVSSPLCLDATLTLIRRVLSGASPSQAHRLHLYQRLHQAGWTHQRVTLAYNLSMLFILLSTFAPSPSFVTVSLLLTTLFGFFLDRFVAAPFRAVGLPR